MLATGSRILNSESTGGPDANRSTRSSHFVEVVSCFCTRAVWGASGPNTRPGNASGRRSRTTRCATRSRVVQPSHRVGASGPTARRISTRAARSRWATDMPHDRPTVYGFTHDYGAKYPKAVAKIFDDLDTLLEFYKYPAEHWIHLRTTNPIESTFATVRLRTKVTKGPGSRAA